MTADPAFWDNLAESYARKPVDDPEAFERKIAVTVARLTPTSVVLDVGCGTGSLALRLAPSAAEVHGLDLSREMIRIANDKARTQGVDNVTFHTGPFDDTFTALADGSCDVVCAYSLLHLVEDLPAALDRVFRLLRPGGTFVSSTVCLADGWFPYGPMLKAMQWLGKAPWVRILSGRELDDAIRRAGFAGLSQPEVGAKPVVAFRVATRPA